MYKLPLEGIRVVEVGDAWAGPGAAQTLGGFGAEVIKVETTTYWPRGSRGTLARPTKEVLRSQMPWTGGYPDREPGEHPWNRNPNFAGQARNKLGMTVRSLSEPKSREIFLRLIKVSDIFISNTGPGVNEKLGIGYKDLVKIKPDIIMVYLTACGLTGPYSDYRTHGQQLDSLGGHTSLRGYADMGPEETSDCSLTDYYGSCFAATSAMMALLQRKKTGKGQMIEIGQFETMPICLGEAMMDYFMNGRVRTRIGNRDIHGAAPCGCYPCQGNDDWINITVQTEQEWKAFKRVMGNPAWADDARFSNILSRLKNHDAMDEFIAAWTKGFDKFDLMNTLQKEGVPAGPVMKSADSYNDPHLKARDYFVKITHADAGTHFYPGPGWKLTGTPVRMDMPPVRLGEHNEYVYKKVIGVSDEEYNGLVASGEISNEPAPDIP